MPCDVHAVASSLLPGRVPPSDSPTKYGTWQGYEEGGNMMLEWWVFSVIWIFLGVNILLYSFRSHK